MARLIEMGKSLVDKMDAILTESHLDTRVKRCIKTRICRRCPRREREVLMIKQLEAVHMTAAKQILGCSSTTSKTVLRAELGVYPRKTNRDVIKMKHEMTILSEGRAKRSCRSWLIELYGRK